MSDLADLTAVDMVEGFRGGTLSPVEVTDAVIARIEAWEPVLNATYAFNPDEARAAARGAELRWRNRQPLGPIDGVPLTIKENMVTAGVPVPLGTAASELTPAQEDSPPAARLRENGGVILAKTTMPDYGMLSSGLSSFHPLARNPWNTDLNPGGSSAGAGAAAAAGYGPLHIGTDIGGSIRLPAGWCGIVGLKPSFGRVPIHPPFIGRVAGPMTRTVADCALMMDVLSEPDARDPMSLPPADIDWSDLDRDVKGLRIGLWLDAGFGQEVAPQVKAAVEQAAKLFEDAGAVVEPVKPFLTRTMIDGLDRFWRARSWSDVSKLPAGTQRKILPYIFAWTETARHYSGLEVFEGFSQIAAMRDAALNASAPFDFLMSPTAPDVAYPAGHAGPVNDPQRPFEHIAFTVSFNMSEQPAISLNCGYTEEGLPVGLQIAGRRFDDLGVLRVARAFEKIRGPQRPWPRF